LLWWTLSPRKLSKAALDACNGISGRGGAVSSISIWEVGIKVKKGKLALPFSVAEYASRLRKVAGLELIPVEASIWLESLALNWRNPDPVDRVIVATARVLDLPLVTRDKEIAAFYPKTVW
jgi:PIN domain nuclease of toxin-antitoxin system